MFLYPTSMQSIRRYLYNGITRNEGVLQLQTFWRCHSLHTRRHRRVKTKRFIYACVEVIEFGQCGGSRLLVRSEIIIQLFPKLLGCGRVPGKLEEKTCQTCRCCVTTGWQYVSSRDAIEATKKGPTFRPQQLSEHPHEGLSSFALLVSQGLRNQPEAKRKDPAVQSSSFS